MLSPKEAQKLRGLLGNKDERLSIVFNALSDKSRCKIFRLFLTRERLCAGDIADILGISMSSASQHLKILELTSLLERERSGRQVYFKPNSGDPLVKAIIKAVS